MVAMPTDPNPLPGPPESRAAREGLRLSDAAGLVGLSASTLRRHVKAGKLKAARVPGKYGTEYRVLPAVLSVFALETLDLNLNLEDVVMGTHTQAPLPPPAPPEDVVKLYERLLTVTEEATRYRVLCETSESTLREVQAQHLEQIAELQAQINTLERRRWWRRGKP